MRGRALLIGGFFLVPDRPPPLRDLHLDGGRWPAVTSTSDSLEDGMPTHPVGRLTVS